MGGHPAGHHMAGVILADGGREHIRGNVVDPFDFVRAYNRAATTDPQAHHVMSDDAMRGLEALEQITRR